MPCRKPAPLHQRHRQRIAHHQRRRGRLTDRRQHRRQLAEQTLELRGLRGKSGAKLQMMLQRVDAETAEFEACTRIAIEERVSFIVQGAGISREIIKWCRAGGVPFAGIVSSGRLAAMYEKWGADFLVAEGAEAGGHIGDVGHPLPTLLEEVLAHTSLPVLAAGGVDAADVSRYLAAGAAGVQVASRFLACADGDGRAKRQDAAAVGGAFDAGPGVTMTRALLTLNADAHALMKRMHKPDPKLPPDRQDRARQVGLMAAMIMRILLLLSISWIASLTQPLMPARIIGTPRPSIITAAKGL